jgi:UDP-2-acetamido-3-amino-2,3-dideoxy-glucuronate N-acetyltransferase
MKKYLKYINLFKFSVFAKKKEKLFYYNFFEKFNFKPVRIYLIKNIHSKNVRGKHAHKKTRQIFFCISGSVTINFYNKHGLLKSIKLNEKKNLSLITLRPVWLELCNFSKSCNLLVLADKKFSKKDYINDRNKIT